MYLTVGSGLMVICSPWLVQSLTLERDLLTSSPGWGVGGSTFSEVGAEQWSSPGNWERLHSLVSPKLGLVL